MDMNYSEFCHWLKAESIEMSFATIGNSGVNGIMQFCKDGEWFLSARNSADTDYFEVKEAIIAGMNGEYAESINDTVTVSEIAQKLGKDTSTVRKAIEKAVATGTLVEGKDCRKSVQAWLVKKVSVKKIYKEFK